MEIMKFIGDRALILIPAIYILGRILKQVKIIRDNNIPLILLAFGVGLSVWMLGLNPNGVIQGILVTGAAVYTHQLIKQSRKDRDNHFDDQKTVVAKPGEEYDQEEEEEIEQEDNN